MKVISLDQCSTIQGGASLEQIQVSLFIMSAATVAGGIVGTIGFTKYQHHSTSGLVGMGLGSLSGLTFSTIGLFLFHYHR